MIVLCVLRDERCDSVLPRRQGFAALRNEHSDNVVEREIHRVAENIRDFAGLVSPILAFRCRSFDSVNEFRNRAEFRSAEIISYYIDVLLVLEIIENYVRYLYERFFSRDLIERAVRDYSVHRRVADVAKIIVKRSVNGYVCYDKSDYVFNDARLDRFNPTVYFVRRYVEHVVYDKFCGLSSVYPRFDIRVVYDIAVCDIRYIAHSDVAEVIGDYIRVFLVLEIVENYVRYLNDCLVSQYLIERAVCDYSVYSLVADIAEIFAQLSVIRYVGYDKSYYVLDDARFDRFNPTVYFISRYVEQVVYDKFCGLSSVYPRFDIRVVYDIAVCDIRYIAHSDVAEVIGDYIRVFLVLEIVENYVRYLNDCLVSQYLIERAVCDYSVYSLVADIAEIFAQLSVIRYVGYDKSYYVLDDARFDRFNPTVYFISRYVEQVVYDKFCGLSSVYPRFDIRVVYDIAVCDIRYVAHSEVAEYS